MQPRYTSARPTRPIYHAGCCLHLTEIILTGGRKKERKVLSFKGKIHGVQTENMEHVVVPFQLVVYALWSYHRGSMCLSCTTKSLCLRDPPSTLLSHSVRSSPAPSLLHPSNRSMPWLSYCLLKCRPTRPFSPSMLGHKIRKR